MTTRSVSQQVVDKHLKSALVEIGPIKPWLDSETGEWIFAHPLYPESCSGESRKEVIKNYPLYLRQFIEHRLKRELAPWLDKTTRGRGGRRAGAGRPKGTVKNPTRVVRLPEDVAIWLQEDPARIERVRKIMHR